MDDFFSSEFVLVFPNGRESFSHLTVSERGLVLFEGDKKIIFIYHTIFIKFVTKFGPVTIKDMQTPPPPSQKW